MLVKDCDWCDAIALYLLSQLCCKKGNALINVLKVSTDRLFTIQHKSPGCNTVGANIIP